LTYVSATGERLASLNAAFGVVDAADTEIVRGDLVGIVHEAARSGAEYIFGDSATGWLRCPEPSRSPSSGQNRARSNRIPATYLAARPNYLQPG
jgi:hypothetical protein